MLIHVTCDTEWLVKTLLSKMIYILIITCIEIKMFDAKKVQNSENQGEAKSSNGTDMECSIKPS